MIAQDSSPKADVLVVGAGLAGMTAAHHLADWGAEMLLVDIAPYIGGAFLLLDRTFTTDSCGLCITLPRQPSYCPTISSELHRSITPLRLTTLTALRGKSGDFVATSCTQPSYVDSERCDNCGACVAVCPIEWPRSTRTFDKAAVSALHSDRPGAWISALPYQRAIYPPPHRAIPFAYTIDPATCARCGACVDPCPQRAIKLAVGGTEMDVRTGEKGYERYVQRVVVLPGVTYGRGHPAAVHELTTSRDLRPLTPESEQTFDMVVLAVGMGPAEDTRYLAAQTDAAPDEFGCLDVDNRAMDRLTRRSGGSTVNGWLEVKDSAEGTMSHLLKVLLDDGEVDGVLVPLRTVDGRNADRRRFFIAHCLSGPRHGHPSCRSMQERCWGASPPATPWVGSQRFSATASYAQWWSSHRLFSVN